MSRVDAPDRAEAQTVKAGGGWLGGPVAFLRNSWRQLTSMRTALVLLFLLAVAAIPGSVLPQRSVNSSDVAVYYRNHPSLAPILDKLGFFQVFAAPWFAAIYLLLFTSLVGCVLPRLRDHLNALLKPPPAAPARFDRLPQHTRFDTHPELQWKGWRRVKKVYPEGTVEISAEKGYLKETGNLLFHASLLVILAGVAIGAQWGWHANRILVRGEDQAFCNSLQQIDNVGLGAAVDPADLPPFCLELTDFVASYRDNGIPARFEATVNGGGKFSVNHPLRLGGANVYLLGTGYAVELRYTDAAGRSQMTVSPYFSMDQNQTGAGVAAFPDANRGQRDRQVGFEGLYMPTAGMGRSKFPAENDPALVLIAYTGNLGLDTGIPTRVDRLTKDRLKQLGEAKVLRKGEVWTLEDGSKVEFVGTRPYAALSIRHDPGEPIVATGVVLLLVGLPLSLYGKRRRVWLRLNPDGTAEAGGLPRTDYPGFADEFKKVTQWPRSPTTS
jgi:cytochrome c biogenesis protein